MVRRRQRNSPQPIGEINLTSLMDLAYALLIVFMLTTPLMYKHLKIDVPKVEKTKKITQETAMHSIGLDAEGRCFIQAMPVLQSELEAYCYAWSQEETLPTVEVEADGQLAYRRVAEVLDLLKFYRLKQVSLKVR